MDTIKFYREISQTDFAGGVALLAAGGAYGGALKLFNSVIPRQDELRVSMKENGR